MLFYLLAQFKHLFTGQGQLVDLTSFWLTVISYTVKERNSVEWRAGSAGSFSAKKCEAQGIAPSLIIREHCVQRDTHLQSLNHLLLQVSLLRLTEVNSSGQKTELFQLSRDI